MATGHRLVPPNACCHEVDDVLDPPLVLSGHSTALDSGEQIVDTSSRKHQQPPSGRTDEQEPLTVKPQEWVLSNFHLESPRLPPDSTEVDLLMQALDESLMSSTDDDGTARGGNDQTRKHVCPFLTCNKAFRQPAYLKTHIRSYTGEKPYRCRMPGCGSVFSQPGNLKTHELRH